MIKKFSIIGFPYSQHLKAFGVKLSFFSVETSEIIDPSEDSGNAENDSISERNSTTTTEECSSTTIPEVSCSVELQSPNTSRKGMIVIFCLSGNKGMIGSTFLI